MLEIVRGGMESVRLCARQLRESGQSVGFVPTMGYLHQGHLSLIEASKRDGNATIVSIFVNPTQFGPNEDFDSYPRDEKGDLERAQRAGAHAAWIPEKTDLYPPGDDMRIDPGEMARCLCGVSRPVFFSGILTVVMKLLHAVTPDRAYFGEKDYQQLTLIRKMTEYFFLETEIIGCPTVREPDGLAMSSRNVRIPAGRRQDALALVRAITAARKAFERGQTNALSVRGQLLGDWPDGVELDYLDFRDPDNLNLVHELKADTRIFLGAWLEGVRLIDNARVGG